MRSFSHAMHDSVQILWRLAAPALAGVSQGVRSSSHAVHDSVQILWRLVMSAKCRNGANGCAATALFSAEIMRNDKFQKRAAS
jgi:hypothetical protein